MSERNPKRFENGSNAQQRSPEEQRRLMEEYDQARYEEAFPAEDAEKGYEEVMASREYDENVLTEGRIMERPEANFMYMMAQQIAELRANGGEPMIIEDKENRLQELLEKYTEKAHAERDLALRNAEINERSTVKGRQIRLEQEMAAEEELENRLKEADFIINSTDEAWVNEKLGAGKAKETAKETSEPIDVDKDRVKDMDEARMLADVAEILRIIKSDPEKAEKDGLYDKAREMMEEVSEALAKAKKAEEEKLKTPKDADDEEEIKTPKDADEAEIKTPKDADEDEEEIKTPKDADDAEIKTPKDVDDEEEIKTPKDADALIDDDTPEEDEPRRRPNIFSRAWTRINLAFAESNGNPAGVIARGINRGIDRFRNSEHVGRNTALVIGGVAIAGVLIYGRTQGWFDGGHGGGGGHHPGDTGGADQGADTGNHGNGNGHNGDTGGDQTPDPTTPEIPKGDTYAHPWNWMNAAIENGSITPPNGMSTEQALHHYGELAAAAGHKVEWYNLPNGLEAIRIDGSDDTKVVADVLTQFAK